MTDNFTETPAEPTTDFWQIVAAVILGVAATLTAVAAFNAALKDGEALQNYTQSTRALSDANYFWSASRQVYAEDFSLFVEYASANTEGNDTLSTYLYGLMRPELQAAVEWWETNDDAFNPFDTEEGSPYVIDEEVAGAEKEGEAESLFEAGATADDNGDEFELAAVFFALTLFFGGIATLFRSKRVTVALLGTSVVTLAIGAVTLFGAF